MKFKLIALDVDGTLLNDHYQISDRTKQIIRKVHEAGSQIVLCTGRGPGSTIPILAELGLEGTVITHNGAATVHWNAAGRQLLHEYAFSLDDIQPLLQYVRQENIQFDVCTAFDMYIEGLGDYEEMYNKFMANPNILPDVTELKLPIVKFSLLSQPDLLDRVEQEWNDQKLYGKLKMIRSGDVFIDVMNPAANKGNALKALADSWHIDAEQVMAVGNYYNDLEMMSFAGLGLAVENSPAGVKAAADGVVSSNNDDGVYEAIAKYCL